MAKRIEHRSIEIAEKLIGFSAHHHDKLKSRRRFKWFSERAQELQDGIRQALDAEGFTKIQLKLIKPKPDTSCCPRCASKRMTPGALAMYVPFEYFE